MARQGAPSPTWSVPSFESQPSLAQESPGILGVAISATGDRLAEVKGRQVLEKYNCNGCHLIRPGVYDFKPGSKTMEKLELAFSRPN